MIHIKRFITGLLVCGLVLLGMSLTSGILDLIGSDNLPKLISAISVIIGIYISGAIIFSYLNRK